MVMADSSAPMQPPEPPPAVLGVGEVARRAGVSVSALHFYERQGLLHSERSAGNQRRYPRDVLRRVALIRIAQEVGIPLKEVAAALEQLPEGRAPTRQDWMTLSQSWQEQLDRRIHKLQQLRDDFGDCIGCGCLSIDRCAMLNRDDALGKQGPGPRRLMAPASLPDADRSRAAPPEDDPDRR